jgi:chaperonin GroES
MAQTASKSKTQLRPMGDRVVIRPAAREETTRSGIVLPDTSKEKPQRGAIIAVGPGRVSDEGKKIPMEVKVGDTVLFAKYAGTEFKLEDDELLILSEKDVLAIVIE